MEYFIVGIIIATYEGGRSYQFESRPGEVVAEEEDEGGQQTGRVHQAQQAVAFPQLAQVPEVYELF